MSKASPRVPMITISCGETGVGKTYRNKLEIAQYLTDQSRTGWKGRKVLAFDTNDDDYPEFETVHPDHLHRLSKPIPRRIRPFHPNGTPMDEEAKKEVVEKILRTYRDGLLVLDDINDYMTGARGQALIGALCTLRHRGLDLLFSFQSIAKIPPTLWENSTWLRLHHQVDDVTRYRKRIPKYPLVRIAQLILDDQYERVGRAVANGQLDAKDAKKLSSFFLLLQTRKGIIKGCSKEAFLRAAKRYIDQEESRKVSMMLKEIDFRGKKVFGNRNEVVVKLLEQKMRHWEPG